MAENEVEYTKPTSQISAEQRLGLEEAPDPGAARSFAVEGNDLSGYVGVSPEYQNYADETHKPGVAEEGVEAKLEELQRKALSTDTDVPADAPRQVAKVEEVDAPSVERVEPKQAAYNIPAQTEDGAVQGDAQAVKAATEGNGGEGQGEPPTPEAEQDEKKPRGGRQAKE